MMHQDEGWRLRQPADPGKVVSAKAGCGCCKDGKPYGPIASPPRCLKEDTVATLIVLDRPSNWHIPYFAMGARYSFENKATPLDLDTDLTKIVGRRYADWVRDRQSGGAIRLLVTRNYLPPQTAVYAHWLSFRERPLANNFLNAFPRYRLEEWLDKLRRKREALEEKVEQRLTRRGYDLSRIGAEERRTVAQRFIDAHDKIRDLVLFQRQLETVGRLALEWSAQI
jgi:hypothetical protein